MNHNAMPIVRGTVSGVGSLFLGFYDRKHQISIPPEASEANFPPTTR